MPCSAARLEANRRNAQQSTGPRTPEGKEASRGNALKHGLTGAGVVVPAEDRAEVDELARGLEAELAPAGSACGRLLARRAAALAVRLERCERAEGAVTADRVRGAAAAFDEARRADADRLWATLAEAPATHARRLRATPEGGDLLLGHLGGLRAAAAERGGIEWSMRLAERFDLIGGRGADEPTASECRVLTLAVAEAEAGDGDPADEVDPAGWRAWALGRIVALIDAEVARLGEHRATLDHAGRALSRAEAGERALVDAGAEATLRRKYEAATERGLFRALAELRQLRREEGAVARPADRPAPAPPRAHQPAPGLGPALGSFCPVPPEPAAPGGGSTLADPIRPVAPARPAGSAAPAARRPG